MLFPPFGRGGGAFQWWGGAPGRQTGAGFMMDFLLNAVTNLILRSGPVAKRWELSLVLPNRRDRLVAARAGILPSRSTMQAMNRLWVYRIGTVAKLAMRQPFVLFKGLTFQKLCLPGAFRPGDHHNKMLRPGLCVVHASPQYL